jgi:PKD repeat protein
MQALPGEGGRLVTVIATVLIVVVAGFASADLATVSTAGSHGRAGGTTVVPAVDRASALGAPLTTSPGTGRPAPSLTPVWTNITAQSSTLPAPRESAGMVYDSTDGYAVMFGGENTNLLPSQTYNDTWKFVAGVWTNITTSVAPSPRFGFMMADDPVDHAVVLFGGQGPGHGLGVWQNDTWEYHAGVWTNVTQSHAPPDTFWGSMSYDSATGDVLLFGGSQRDAPTYNNDTWSFHAGVWTELSPSTLPPARDDQVQVDDVADNEVLMFGGDGETVDFNDTWAYSGGTWSLVASATGPDIRAGPGMAYDASAGAVVMYGGFPASDYYYSTWVFQAGIWTDFATSPTPPAGTIWGQMTYDAADRYVLLFQGNGQSSTTWALNFTGGGAPPLSVTANAAPLSGDAPLPVTFTAAASGGTAPFAYFWNFGDGTNSSNGNTTHTYESAGTYPVTLNVSDHASGKVSKSWTVVVGAVGLQATISATPLRASIGQNVTFSSIVSGGTPPYSYSWTFGDEASATTPSATHSYAANGSYLVVFIVHDSGDASVTRNVTIVVGAPGVGNSPATNDLSYWILLVVVIAIVLILLALVLRRRSRPPATPTNAVPGPSTGPPS